MEEKIIARVRKMLALAKDAAATEGERDNALRMAYATLAKHNLSMAAVDAPAAEDRRSEVTTIRHRMWMTHIHNAVAKLFFCHLFMTKKGAYIDLTLIGKESNIITAKDLANHLCNSILKENKRRNFSQTELASFNKGAAHRITERCEQLRREAEASTETASGTSLVLASLYQRESVANEDYIRDVMKLTLHQTKARRSTIRSDAYAAGRTYGDSLNLNRSITGSKASTTNLIGG